MKWWNRLRDRHDDGTEHDFVKTKEPIGTHWCDDYCHHYRVRCTICGEPRLLGYGVPEVR